MVVLHQFSFDFICNPKASTGACSIVDALINIPSQPVQLLDKTAGIRKPISWVTILAKHCGLGFYCIWKQFKMQWCFFLFISFRPSHLSTVFCSFACVLWWMMVLNSFWLNRFLVLTTLNVRIIFDLQFLAEPDVLKEVKQNLGLGSVKFEVGYVYVCFYCHNHIPKMQCWNRIWQWLKYGHLNIPSCNSAGIPVFEGNFS